MEGKYKKGTLMLWKSTGQPAYEKLDNDDWGTWVCLFSNYLVEGKEIVNSKEETTFTLRPESEKPLYNSKGQFNRFGFTNTDEGTYQSYKGIFTFVEPEN